MKYSVVILHKLHRLYIAKVIWLIFLGKHFFCSENYAKSTNTLCPKNEETFNIKQTVYRSRIVH